ncbi:acetamidase/formamidase family protein [Caenibius tardaugens NBRC 16725]|uniref:Acetamidase/formamidase family protein n=1 Tax=Caenibius tardaugens NBRC 16725 TaxID=1219035 RepID=U3A616_9SPHN|nr:acetamidase/formamidase family protein [Caenibius tardaugens]AZI35539.1 acetamidase [Caenibius tardaugens NBRC 16725]GAD50183.1 acetamidase/formamidase family protein [Caenibius tardaugens NBRC 16725]
MSDAMTIVQVSDYSGGIVGPGIEPAGTVQNGGTIRTGTPPGCWGPMITPKFQGGHEVTRPVLVEGAEVGDAVAIRLKKVQVTSLATSSGVMTFVDGRYSGDPFVAKHCDSCGAISPPSHVEGIGDEAVRCDNCGAEVSAFRFSNGYVIVLDRENAVSLTVGQDIADRIAGNAQELAALPELSGQHSILSLARADISGLSSRMRPFLGNIGTTPSRDLPDSHNAGDFGSFLVGAPHDYAMTQEELETHKTDGHMDTNSVREGAILICPVKVPGAGIYMGDMHAQQGNGEIAGHATDVAGEVELEVEVIKGLTLDGPILLQRADDLPPLAQPLSRSERTAVDALAKRWGQTDIEDNAPITFIGSGVTLNDATKNGLDRAAKVTGLPYDEILNRATIAGSIEISRLPGVVRVTFQCPKAIIERMGIAHLVAEQYGVSESE